MRRDGNCYEGLVVVIDWRDLFTEYAACRLTEELHFLDDATVFVPPTVGATTNRVSVVRSGILGTNRGGSTAPSGSHLVPKSRISYN